MVLKWRLIKEVLCVAPDYAKAQNLSSYGAGENTMVVEDALSRIDSILEMQPLKETEKKEILKKKDGIYANMMKTQLMAADWSL